MNSTPRILIILFSMISILCGSLNNLHAQEYRDNEFEEEFLDDFADFGNSTSKTKNNDPLEPLNRTIFVFNETFDQYFFEHVARTYRLVIPRKARSSIGNFLDNLSKPLSLVNSIAQGKVNNSLSTLSSFLINSTIGIFGLFDVAKANGIKYEKEDFGQTLGYYGVKSGIYLVVPFTGPSSLRDFSGWIIDSSINPTGLNYLKIGQKEDLLANDTRISLSIMSAVDTREGLINLIDDLRKDSFDPYATMRSAYIQNRISKIKK